MIDTVNLCLTTPDVKGGADFLSEIPPYLDNINLHNYEGKEVVTGSLDNLRVVVSGWQIKVGEGSLCKFLLGDNFQTMGRAGIKTAVEKISDSLHLDLSQAEVKRLDIAENFVVKHPPQVYFNHLGLLANAKRLAQPDGIYYKGKTKTLCFYDKVKEQRTKREQIPELYQHSNVLRYEQRYTGRLGAAFKVGAVKASTLYDEGFYIELLNRWRDDYRAIKKINDVTPNFEFMKTKRDFDLLGRLAYIEQIGGEVAMIEQIKEAQDRGDLTPKQAFDLRKAVKDSCKVRESLTAPSEAITVLDKKIAEAVRFYR
ncbi:MAG: hypothetical protein HDS42_06750 [Bacteroides sp.]|nr:hypothetical protein [Bacteroides sp.]